MTRLTVQKNALLKSCRSIAAACELVDSYDGELAASSKAITGARIKYLEQQVEYKDQEIAFLKKIVSLGKGEKDS